MNKDAFAFPPFGPDMDTLAAMQRRNLDTLSLAGRIVTDGLKAATKQQNDRLYASFQRLIDTGEQAKAKTYRPNEQLLEMRAAFARALDDAGVIGGLLIETQTEAANVVTQGLLENVDDLVGGMTTSLT